MHSDVTVSPLGWHTTGRSNYTAVDCRGLVMVEQQTGEYVVLRAIVGAVMGICRCLLSLAHPVSDVPLLHVVLLRMV